MSFHTSLVDNSNIQKKNDALSVLFY
jgi:hypothetical protein